MKKVVCLIVLVLCVSTTECYDGKYLFLFPKTIRSGVEYVFSGLNLGNVPINVSSTLLNYEHTPLATQITDLRTISKISLTVPEGLPIRKYGTKIRLEGSGGAVFNDFFMLGYEQENEVLLIQTDKKIYKSGQTVKYRVFAVKHDLTTHRTELEITIEDARKNKLVKYKKMGDLYGVVEGKFQISTDPIYGDWKITAKSAVVTESVTISIDKYVLPKDKANIILPSFLEFGQQQPITVKVTGKYTNDKPISGTAMLKLKIDWYPTTDWVYNSTTKRYEHIHFVQPTLLYNLTLVNGQASVDITKTELEGLMYLKYFWNQRLKAEANVTETETQIVYQAEDAETQYFRYRETIKFLMKPTSFKVGLRNVYYVQLFNRDGKPLVGDVKNITITPKYKFDEIPPPPPPPLSTLPPFTYPANYTGSTTTTPPHTTPQQTIIDGPYGPYGPWEWHGYSGGVADRCIVKQWFLRTLPAQTYQVPENGLVKVEMIITDPSAFELQLTADYDNKVSDVLDGLVVAQSPSNTFLSLQLLTSEPKINQFVEFDISSNKEFSSVFVVTLAKGQVQDTRRKSFSTSLKTQTMKLYILPSFTPSVRVIIYFITTNKEIVADAIQFNVKGMFKHKVSVQFDKDEVQPAEKTTLSVHGAPHSNAYVVAVDKSTTLLGAEHQDLPGEIEQFMVGLDTGSIPTFNGQSSRNYYRNYYNYYYTSEVNVNDIIKYNGMHVFTDAQLNDVVPVKPCFEHPTYHVLKHELAPIPTSMFKDDGEMRIAATKSDLKKKLQVAVSSRTVDTVDATVLDGCALLWSVHRPEKAPLYIPTSPIPPRPPVDGGYNEPPTDWEDSTRTRSFFPETWIWESKIISADGFANFTLTVPDTITSWVAGGFAVNPSKLHGVGFSAETASINVYQDFYVNVNLPSSVIRQEELLIQAAVFNYLPHDIQATITLENPSGFVILKVDDQGFFVESHEPETRLIQVPKDKSGSVFFAIKAVELGNLDIQVYAKSSNNQAGDKIVKTLLVESEGVPIEYSQSVLVDLSDGSASFYQKVSVPFPSGYIGGSQKIVITASGLLNVNPLVNDLTGLIKMPYGCGEQNLLNLVPNIYVRKYLDQLNLLTEDIKTNTYTHMSAGYIRELNYRRTDGSFSAFGDNDKLGSLWLTAYVVQSLAAASKYIYVDENVLRTGGLFLIVHQYNNGTYKETGRVIHKELQGSTAAGIALTAFTVKALDSLPDDLFTPQQTEGISRAYEALKTASASLDDPYDMAITAHALLTSNSSFASFGADLLLKLEGFKTVEGDLVYWKIESTYTPYYSWIPPGSTRHNSATIECTAYMLLIYAHQKDIAKGAPVLRWLLKQQNAHGGFRTSSDTVLALQALSEFVPLLYGSEQNTSITVSACRDIQTWTITHYDAAVLRKWVITEPIEHVYINATGSGRALVNILTKYYVEDIDAQTAFSCRVKIVEETVEKLHIEVCAEYTVPDVSSSMTIMDVVVVSGFSLDYEASNLDNNPLIKRHEPGFRKVLLYFDEIGNNATCVNIIMKRSDKIGKTKPAFVTVYDYYDPDNSVTTFYQASKASQMDVCQTCTGSCDVCETAKKRRRRSTH